MSHQSDDTFPAGETTVEIQPNPTPERPGTQVDEPRLNPEFNPAHPSTEEEARDLLWREKFKETGYRCNRCGSRRFYNLKSRPEVRECRHCRKQQRVRAETWFEGSKIALLDWVKALDLFRSRQGRITAMALKRSLGLSRYETAWLLLAKIREAVRDQIDETTTTRDLIGRLARMTPANSNRARAAVNKLN